MEYIRSENVQAQRQRRTVELNKSRQELSDVEESLKQLTPEDVCKLTKALKRTKRQFSVQNLRKLKNGLSQSPENVEAFLSIDGALKVLVSFLVKVEVNAASQCEAVCCIANLAFGDPAKVTQVARAAVPYLLILLSVLSPQLQDDCAFALGNLAGSDSKTCELLLQQGALMTLLQHLKSPFIQVQNSVFYALMLLTRTGIHLMDSSQVECIVEKLMPRLDKDPPEECYWILFHVSCVPVSEAVFQRHNIEQKLVHTLSKSELNVEEVTPVVRTLANLVTSEEKCVNVLKDCQVLDIILCLLKSSVSHSKRETVWLVGNVVNHPSNVVQAMLIEMGFCNKLQLALLEAVQSVEHFVCVTL